MEEDKRALSLTLGQKKTLAFGILSVVCNVIHSCPRPMMCHTCAYTCWPPPLPKGKREKKLGITVRCTRCWELIWLKWCWPSEPLALHAFVIALLNPLAVLHVGQVRLLTFYRDLREPQPKPIDCNKCQQDSRPVLFLLVFVLEPWCRNESVTIQEVFPVSEKASYKCPHLSWCAIDYPLLVLHHLTL